MAIPADKVSNFIPVHELDNLGPNTRYDETTREYVYADLGDLDLFIVSKLCALADDDSNAIMVSKALKYGNMRDKLSGDFGVQTTKDNVYKISNDLCVFSCDTIEKINWLSGQYVPEICSDIYESLSCISSDLETRKAEKRTTPLQVPQLTAGQFIKRIRFFENGKMQDIGTGDWDYISSYVNIDGTKVASGTILGNRTQQTEIELTNENTSTVSCNVTDDCYFTVELSILETDSCNKPIELWLHNISSDNISKYKEFSMKLDQFNNPGGFSGVKYMNYFFGGYPIKYSDDITKDRKTATRSTYVEIRYSDGSKFKYDTQKKSKFRFSQYPLYATVAKDELQRYVIRDPQLSNQYDQALYKFAIINGGLVSAPEEYKIKDIMNDSPVPTKDQSGTIRIGKTDVITQNTQTIGLKIDSNKQAYVNIKEARSDSYGTVKIYDNNQKHTLVDGFLNLPIYKSTDGKIYTKIQAGTSSLIDKYSIVKTGQLSDNYDDNDKEYKIVYLQANDNGYGYSTIPHASEENYGVVKLGIQQNPGEVYRAQDGKIKVNLGIAKNTIASPNNYDNRVDIKLYDNDWIQNGTVYRIEKELPMVNESTVVIVYQKCKDFSRPEYGVYVKIYNRDDCVCSTIFNPRYSSAITPTSENKENDQRFLGSVNGCTKIVIESKNKGFDGGDPDSIMVCFKNIQ